MFNPGHAAGRGPRARRLPGPGDLGTAHHRSPVAATGRPGSVPHPVARLGFV